ncbi:MAG TPA: hypothetical protein VHL98_04765 [Microvirga sp.]|jgi:hypothetical protein|nr:hypothetical protein [Microvirga sp.]
MSVGAGRTGPEEQRRTAAGMVLVLFAVGCLVASGLLLWARRGDAVFSDLVLSALAWCF